MKPEVLQGSQMTSGIAIGLVTKPIRVSQLASIFTEIPRLDITYRDTPALPCAALCKVSLVSSRRSHEYRGQPLTRQI